MRGARGARRTPGAFADLSPTLCRRAALRGDVAAAPPPRRSCRRATSAAGALAASSLGAAATPTPPRASSRATRSCRAISPASSCDRLAAVERWKNRRSRLGRLRRGAAADGASSASASTLGSARQVGGEATAAEAGGWRAEACARRYATPTEHARLAAAAPSSAARCCCSPPRRRRSSPPTAAPRWSSLPAPQQEDVALNLGVLAALAALAALLVGVQAAAWPLLCLRVGDDARRGGARRAPRADGVPHGDAERPPRRALLEGRRRPRRLAAVDAAQAFVRRRAVASLATIVASAPLVAPAVAVAALALVRIVAKYRPTAGEAKRLVSVLHGPIVSLLLEGLGGREYLRAYCQQHAAADEAVALLEASARAQTFNIALQRWLALRLEALGAAILLCVSLLCVGARGRVPLGLSGLSLTYSMTLTNLAKYLVNYATRADAQFASFDRVQALTAVKSEASAADGDGAAGGGKAAPPRSGRRAARWCSTRTCPRRTRRTARRRCSR